MTNILIKTPENELKNAFVMKLNEQSLNIFKITLHSANPAEDSKAA